jgi:hypothetical protein
VKDPETEREREKEIKRAWSFLSKKVTQKD